MSNVNIFSNNQSGIDIFGFNGLAKIVGSFLEYKKFKIQLTKENKESLFHLLRKDALSSEDKTKNLIDKILKGYQDNKWILSMQVIKILEYMDDALLEAISKIELDDEKNFAHFDEKNKNHVLLLTNNLIIKETQVFDASGNLDYGDYDDEDGVAIEVLLENIYKPSPELLSIKDFLNSDD